MKVIVGTSVWSLALRRRKIVSSHPKVLLLKNLIVEDDVILLGVVRQEILSGIRHQNQYEQCIIYKNKAIAFAVGWCSVP